MAFNFLTNPQSVLNICARTITSFCENHLGFKTPEHHTSPKRENIESSSGPARTHPIVLDIKPTTYGPRVAHKDKFLCKGGVDTVKLLDVSRRGLYSTAKEMGGNVLLEEQWDCKICHPRFHKHDRFKVTIHYSAQVARSLGSDAQTPIEAAAAKGVKGLMTVLDRQPEC
ncbi:hypothetical protein BJ138DRAFT_947595 [Hygrophoropsis aurantiaca]|uniref:Uncharacterized protein n=1 Tax=Hygrophoropsis aurantiaca TaxID=72124 RepID=A0ACB8AD82_9AGAM|nr:hypothetical protein BJ138DRAFT_947595 [Hygrophoropsis aurantiaca]